jgi:transmembrane sensor
MESISEIAARWAVRCHAGSLGSDEQQDLDTWLAADPRHRGAYVRARAQWVDLDRLAALHGPVSPVTEYDLTAEPAGEPAKGQNRTLQAISRRQLLAASVAALGIVSGGLSWVVIWRGRERYVSGIGEVRRISLADGSTMVLNTDTDVIVRLSQQQRDVHLIRGEALFEVAHDKDRPFIVRAADSAVRAVGTAFAVRLQAAKVDVTVVEGVVEVSDGMNGSDSGGLGPTAAGVKPRRVKANEHIVIAPRRSPKIEPIATAEANRRLAWREGIVSFDGESLATAVSEINRHNRRQIVIDDPVLGNRPVVGVFRTTDLDGFAAAAAAALNAHPVADGDVIRLEPTTAQTTK